MKIQDIYKFNYKLLEQPVRKGVLAVVGGTFQKADTKNANGRIYPRELWKDVLTREDVAERIRDRQMLGMFGHPASGQTDPMAISHIITKQELQQDGTVYGEAEIVDTPAGRVVETLMRAGVKLGISSRGDGSVERNGGSEEVQDDFRLETYDFVLKPSTPGAYPELVESVEESQRNDKAVVDAISGLVNSKIPSDKRLPVLTQCLKTLNVLESKDLLNQVKSLSQRITEEMLSGTSVVSVSAAGIANPRKHKQEVSMNPNSTGSRAQGLDSNMLAWHKNQLGLAVKQAVTAKNEELRKLKGSLVKVQHEAIDTRKRLTAAEDIIDDFQAKLKRAGNRDVAPQYESLKKRYAAAVDLLEAAIEKLPSIGKLSRRSAALEGLLEAAINKYRKDSMGDIKEAFLERLPSNLQEAAKKAFRPCHTPEEVAETFKALMYASGKSYRTSEPLPRKGGRMTESSTRTASQSSDQPIDFMSRVASRLSQAV